MDSKNPYAPPIAVDTPKRRMPVSGLWPIILCLMSILAALGALLFLGWAIHYRLSNTPYLARLPPPGIPFLVVDSAIGLSCACGWLFAWLSVMMGGRAFRRWSDSEAAGG